MVDFDFIHKIRATLQGASRRLRNYKFHFRISPPDTILVLHHVSGEMKSHCCKDLTTSLQSSFVLLAENILLLVEFLYGKIFQKLEILTNTPSLKFLQLEHHIP